MLQFMRLLVTMRFHSVLVLHLLLLGIVATMSPLQRPKKADVAKHPKVFRHVGLLVNEPPG